MTPMGRNHEEIKELIAAYVLGAVARSEVPLVRAHILTCDECMEEADRLAGIASSLALDVEDEPLPEGFADRILQTATEGDLPVPSEAAPRRRWSFIPAFGGVALLLALIIVTASLFQVRSDLERKERALTALLHSDDGIELKGTSGATARMVPTASGSYFVVVGLHGAPSNHTYQLWLLRDGAPTSGGTFDVTDGIALLETGISLERFDAAAVTIEPSGGSPGPTTDPILTST